VIYLSKVYFGLDDMTFLMVASVIIDIIYRMLAFKFLFSVVISAWTLIKVFLLCHSFSNRYRGANFILIYNFLVERAKV